MNNETGIIKARIDSKLYDVLKIILSKLNISQQELLEKEIKDYIIENIHLIIDVKSDDK